jgi:hypothetical protein
MKSIKLEFKNNKIIVHKQGEYKGCDGQMYPYASTHVEGTGAKDIWDYIRYLESKTK